MRPRCSERGTSVQKSRLSEIRAVIGLVAIGALASSCSVIDQLGFARFSKNVEATAEATKAAARGFVRVEDLPRVEFVRIDELSKAPPVLGRMVDGTELTPRLIRLAADVLHHHEGPLGTQVLVNAGNDTYIARFEWHYHDEHGNEKPRGWHKGVTLYTTE